MWGHWFSTCSGVLVLSRSVFFHGASFFASVYRSVILLFYFHFLRPGPYQACSKELIQGMFSWTSVRVSFSICFSQKSSMWTIGHFTIEIIFGFHNAQFLSITRLIAVYRLSIIVGRSSSYAFLLVAVFNKVPLCCIHFYHFCSLHDELSSVLEAVSEVPISYYWLLLSSLTSLLQVWRLGTEPLHSCQRNCR